ncbi:hypothetical protein CHCC20375_1060 [Bacillus licheniformis]|nr:hypothetical protein CHCC20375_1060 [Bacillus licheniformis]
MKSPLFKSNNPEYMQDESFLYRLILCFFFLYSWGGPFSQRSNTLFSFI